MATKETRGRKKEESKKKRKKREEREVISWNEQARKAYRKKTEKIGWEDEKEDWTLNRKQEKFKNIVKKAMIYKKNKIIKKGIGHKDWYDRSCTQKKKKTKRIYRKQRKRSEGRFYGKYKKFKKIFGVKKEAKTKKLN